MKGSTLFFVLDAEFSYPARNGELEAYIKYCHMEKKKELNCELEKVASTESTIQRIFPLSTAFFSLLEQEEK